MKTVLLILLCLMALQSSAISISENINISDNGTGAACESEGVYISFGVGSFVDDGDGNDYYARAVVDARGVVMSFNLLHNFTKYITLIRGKMVLIVILNE